jgi:hypothetical protein
MADREKGNEQPGKRKATDDDQDVDPESQTNKRLRGETNNLLNLGIELQTALAQPVRDLANATTVADATTAEASIKEAEASIKEAEEAADKKILDIVDRILSGNVTENVTGKKRSSREISSSINDVARFDVKIPGKIPDKKPARKPVTIPASQQYETEMSKFHARKKAKELNDFADNLERHQQIIIAAAADIAQYQARVCEENINLPKVLRTVVAVKEIIDKEPILKKSPNVTKLLLNIIDLHNTKNTPIQIQKKCQLLGEMIISKEETDFTVQEKVELTSLILMIRDTMSLMSDETLPIIQQYVKSIKNDHGHTELYQTYTRAEQRAIDVLAPTFRCCSAFTNWITRLPKAIADSKTFKWTKTAIEWGFNPWAVSTIGSWLNQEAVIQSVKDGGLLPNVYPTEYLSFKLAFILSTLVFGSSIYFYYLKKFREEPIPLPTNTSSEPISNSNSKETSSSGTTLASIPHDHPFKEEHDIYKFTEFLQKVREDYFPNIEERVEKDRKSMNEINQFGSMKHRVEAAISDKCELDRHAAKVAASEKTQYENLLNIPQDKRTALEVSSAVIGHRRVRQINTAHPSAKKLVDEIIEASNKPAPHREGASAAADSFPQDQQIPRQQQPLTFSNFGTAAGIYVTADASNNQRSAATADTAALNQAASEAAADAAALAQAAATNDNKTVMQFRRMRKSVRKSKRRSVKKSLRKSKRKSVKKSTKKPLRKSVKKSVRKSLRKSVRKSVKKSPRKSVRKSVKKSLRKPLKKSVRKSVKKSVRKSLRKPLKKSVRKSLKKSVRKSTRKNKQMKKSR